MMQKASGNQNGTRRLAVLGGSDSRGLPSPDVGASPGQWLAAAGKHPAAGRIVRERNVLAGSELRRQNRQYGQAV
jgi:hypothetical protein